MKKIFSFFFISALFMSCSQNDKSDAYGNFEAIEVTISSESNGQITKLNITEGQDVNLGDTIAQIDTTDLFLKKEQLIKQKGVSHAKISNINAQLNVQEQQKKNLLVDKNRLDNLMKDGAATQKQVDDLNGNLDLLETQLQATAVQKQTVLAELAALEVQIAQVAEMISKCTVVSPLKGTVLVKYAEQGEVTAMGKPICKMANLDELELKVYITGDQLPYLDIGQTVEVLIDKDRTDFKKLEGKVSWISSKAEFTPKTIQTKQERVNLVYAAKVIVKNDGQLKIGMPGEINFMPASSK